MTSDKGVQVVKVTIIALILGLIMIVTGCNSARRSLRADLPNDAQIVGGGFSIDWISPSRGTVYVVERTSGKILITEALNNGESFSFDIDPEEDAAKFKMATGVDPSEARIVLYFKPAGR